MTTSMIACRININNGLFRKLNKYYKKIVEPEYRKFNDDDLIQNFKETYNNNGQFSVDYHTYNKPGDYIISIEDSFRGPHIVNIKNSELEKLKVEYHIHTRSEADWNQGAWINLYRPYDGNNKLKVVKGYNSLGDCRDFNVKFDFLEKDTTNWGCLFRTL